MLHCAPQSIASCRRFDSIDREDECSVASRIYVGVEDRLGDIERSNETCKEGPKKKYAVDAFISCDSETTAGGDIHRSYVVHVETSPIEIAPLSAYIRALWQRYGFK